MVSEKSFQKKSSGMPCGIGFKNKKAFFLKNSFKIFQKNFVSKVHALIFALRFKKGVSSKTKRKIGFQKYF